MGGPPHSFDQWSECRRIMDGGDRLAHAFLAWDFYELCPAPGIDPGKPGREAEPGENKPLEVLGAFLSGIRYRHGCSLAVAGIMGDHSHRPSRGVVLHHECSPG